MLRERIHDFCSLSVLQGFQVLLLLGCLLLFGVKVESRRKSWSWSYDAPSCRAQSVSIAEYGGVGDGTTVNTKAFQKAIDFLSGFSEKGGGQLYIPPGKWLTGSFNLTSHFTLYLHKDAVILGSEVSSLFNFYLLFVLLSDIGVSDRLRATLPPRIA